jgi:uncharacterized protein (TIGR01777 family)
MSRRLVIAGGSGTIGQHLISHFAQEFSDIVVLSRSAGKSKGYRRVQWDGRNQGDWTEVVDGAEVVINLSGKSIQSRFTEENKKLLLNSRVDSTKAIGLAIQEAKSPPTLWLNASGAAIYPATIEQANDERVKETGKGFKSELSIAWEEAAKGFDIPHTRQVIMRITPVLTRKDGFLPPILTITRLGLGGPQGSGKQIVSWIHHKDLCRAMEFVMKNQEIKGVVNMAAPGPVSNKLLMRLMRKEVGMPLGIPAPEFAIKLGSRLTGVEPSLILESSHVVPGVLQTHGFRFEFPRLPEALRDLI